MTINTTTLKPLLIILTIIGIALPYSAFLPFVFEHGLNLPLFFEHATANHISMFAWADVLVAAVVLLVVAFGNRLITIKQALLVALLTCAAGGSAGLPLFFYFFFSRSDSSRQN